MNENINNKLDKEVTRWLTYALIDSNLVEYTLTLDNDTIQYNEFEHTENGIKINHYPIHNDERKKDDLEKLKTNLLELHEFSTEEELINLLRYKMYKHHYTPTDIVNTINALVKSENYNLANKNIQTIMNTVVLNTLSFLGVAINGIEKISFNGDYLEDDEDINENNELMIQDVINIMDNNYKICTLSNTTIPQDKIIIEKAINEYKSKQTNQSKSTNTNNSSLTIEELRKEYKGILSYKDIIDFLPEVEKISGKFNYKKANISLEDSESIHGYSIVENHKPNKKLQYLYFSPSLQRKYYAYYKWCRIENNQSIEEATSSVIKMIANDCNLMQARKTQSEEHTQE